MARSANHEHVAETLVEDDLRRQSRVGAAEQHDVGVLACDETRAVLDTLTGMLRLSVDEAPVTFAQNVPRLFRGQSDHVV